MNKPPGMWYAWVTSSMFWALIFAEDVRVVEDFRVPPGAIFCPVVRGRYATCCGFQSVSIPDFRRRVEERASFFRAGAAMPCPVAFDEQCECVVAATIVS